MKKRYTEGQIVYALKQAELGEKVTEICRKMGVAEATFYTWRKKYKGMGVSELRRMKELVEENRRLKGLVADMALDNDILKEAASGNF